MKVIELLTKIANGEEVPNKIIYNGLRYYNVGNKTQAYYENSEADEFSFIRAIYSEKHLNDEVEVIEEDKKIEEIDVLQKILSEDKIEVLTKEVRDIEKKFNEIIKVINEMREDK